MIKNFTAYFFVLIAACIMLAHAVIPHCHHDQFIFPADHHAGMDSDHENETQHKDCESADFCLLKQYFSVPGNDAKSVPGQVATDESDELVSDLIFNVLCPVIPPGSFSQPVQVRQSGYTAFIHSISGLRAPPASII